MFDACLNTFWIREGSRFLVIKKLVHVKISSETTGSFYRPLVRYSRLWKSKNIKHSTSSGKKTGWQGNLKFYGKSNFSFIVCWIRDALFPHTYLPCNRSFPLQFSKRGNTVPYKKNRQRKPIQTISLNLDLETIFIFHPSQTNFVSSLSLYRDKLHILYIMIKNDSELLSLRFFVLVVY